MQRKLRGFTLTELVIVAGVSVLLIGMLLPLMASARTMAARTQCQANLRCIGMLIAQYAGNNHGHLAAAGNFGLWEKPVGYPIDPFNGSAYWGNRYLPYVNRTDRDPKAARALWKCPSADLMTTPVGMYSAADYNPEQPATYGVNRTATNGTLLHWPHPSTMIFCHDAPEFNMEGYDDSLSSWGASINFPQWRPGGSSYIAGADREFYRHNQSCNVLWLDGHVSSIYASNGQDVPKSWYLGN